MNRREYEIESIMVNRKIIRSVIINSHYEENHGDYMNDALILELVQKLNGRIELPVEQDDGFSYFATLLERDDKQYRLIWLMEDHAIYVGVINAYRDDRKE